MVENGNEMISVTILSLPLFQEGKLLPLVPRKKDVH